MKENENFKLIREWAEKRGIYSNGDIKTQTLKLVEEVGELSKAVLKEDENEFVDAIGDCVVVLTNVAELGSRHFRGNSLDLLIETCINSAWNVISIREGEMINGTFVKAIDLPEKVTNMAQVYGLFLHLYKEGYMYHPEDNAADIIDPKQDGIKRLFTNTQAVHVNMLMDQCWTITKSSGLDLCAIALDFINSK